jgi:putative membrane protein
MSPHMQRLYKRKTLSLRTMNRFNGHAVSEIHMKNITKLLYTGVLGCAGVLAIAAHADTTKDDREFLATAAQSDFNEIKLSQLAEQKAASPDVKAFARTMVKEHGMLEENMKPFAQQFGLNPPVALDSDHQKEYDKLKGLSGKAFDKEYVDAMDKDHHKAFDLFTKETDKTDNIKFKEAVMNGKSAVAAHTNMADDLKNKVS